MKDIYLIGDTHGSFVNIERLNNTSDSIIIVLGDFGFIWDKNRMYNELYKLQKTMADRNNILLFVDGNHENFELLDTFPVIDKFGGKVRRIKDNIFHLMRGEVFNIENKSFFVMGGANSIDKEWRLNRVSWWAEEDITARDIENGLDNLEKVNNTVDYVLTHTCPQDVKLRLGFKTLYDSRNEIILQKFENLIIFKHWYFGHMHIDETISNFTCLYYSYIKISD